MAELFNDQFNNYVDGSHIADSPQWDHNLTDGATNPNAFVAVESSADCKLMSSTVTAPFSMKIMYWVDSPATADYRSVTEVWTDGVYSGYHGCCIRADPVEVTGYYALMKPNSGRIYLFRREASNQIVTLGSWPFTFVANQRYVLELEMSGTEITVRLDGVTVITATDTVYANAGFTGLALLYGSNHTWRWGSFVVNDLNASGPITVVASDSFTVVVSDALVANDGVLASGDSAGLTVSDTVTTVQLLLQAGDSISAAITDASANQLSTTKGDALTITVSETVNVFIHLTRPDGLAMSTLEVVDLAITLAASDHVGMATAEGLVAVAGVLQLSDVLGVQVSDAALDVFSIVVSSDVSIVAVIDVVNVFIPFLANDSVTLTLADAATGIALAVRLVDTLDVSATDAVQSVAVLLSRTDGLSLSLADVIDVLLLINRGDSLNISITETNILAGLVAALESINLSITDAGTRQAIGTIIARLTARLRVYPTLFGKAKVNNE